MKNLRRLLVITLMITAFNANAQFKFGLGGGVNYANFSGSDVAGSNSLMGFNGGVMMEVKLPVKLGVEADILFSTKGANYSFFTLSENIRLSYIDIPVVAKVYMMKVVSLHLGAQYSMLASANFAGDDVKDQFNSGDLAAVVGVGIDVSKLHFSARYNYGLSSIDKGGADVKNNMLTLTVGFWLKK